MQSLRMFWPMCTPAGTHLRDESTSKLCIYLLTFSSRYCNASSCGAQCQGSSVSQQKILQCQLPNTTMSPGARAQTSHGRPWFAMNTWAPLPLRRRQHRLQLTSSANLRRPSCAAEAAVALLKPLQNLRSHLSDLTGLSIGTAPSLSGK